MAINWCCDMGRGTTSNRRWLLGLLLVAAAATPQAAAGVPDWLRQAAAEALPNYADDTQAVVLLDEQVTRVKEDGEITTLHRRAYKILRPAGRKRATVAVYFDSTTKLTFLKGWSIPAQGKEYEVKEKDAMETGLSSEMLYQDTRYKVLTIPGAEPGSIVGYEYEQKERPYVFQETFWFQKDIPVHRARFVLSLPPGWEYQAHWANHDPPATGAPAWELTDLPAVESEPSMPAWRALAARVAVNYFPKDAGLREKSLASWRDVGLWYARLTADRRDASPEMREKAATLTAGAPNTAEKIRRLAAFLQRDVRYVAIELGIGGHQPHFAADVFAHRYGDCKDKATLLAAMLHEIGVESYYVLVQTERGVVTPDSPALTFNHAILAIRLPPDVPADAFAATWQDPKLGRLLFFDPTSDLTPIGSLPSDEQKNLVLLVTADGGELVEVPLLRPETNHLQRTATLTLNANGSLAGEVRELRSGNHAAVRRARLLAVPAAQRAKVVEDFLGSFLSGFSLLSSEVENLDQFDHDLGLRYRFSAQNYAQRAGDLLLVRPRVLGEKSSDILESKDRKYPVEFDSASLESDTYEITLPEGYEVDELPPPTVLDAGFAEYHSRVEMKGNVLRYQRELRIKEVLVPNERLPELKKFYRRVAADENRSAVFKRAAR
jgi:transglutaminase-like putative cysteine protease